MTDIVKNYAAWLVDYLRNGTIHNELYQDGYANLRDVIFPPQAFSGMAENWVKSQDPGVVALLGILKSENVDLQDLEAAITYLYFNFEEEEEVHEGGSQDDAFSGEHAPFLPVLDEYPALKNMVDNVDSEAGAKQFLAHLGIDDELIARFTEFERLADEGI